MARTAGSRTLLDEIGRLERMIGSGRSASRQREAAPRRRTLASEIEEVEQLLASENLVDEIGLDTDMGEGAPKARACDVMDMDDDIMDMGDDVLSQDMFGQEDLDDDVMNEALGCLASEADQQGIEEDITQDYLAEVEKEQGGEDIPTDESVIETAPTGYTAKLAEASHRLDRVASYLEQNGQVRLAFRIDKFADALDVERARILRASK